MSNILVLAAHPDDETLGCGATIKKLSQSSNNIHLMTFADGESGRRNADGKRSKVLDSVCQKLGINSYKAFDFPDNKMDSVPLLDICQEIEDNVPFTPDMILTHWIHDLNVDHSIVARVTATVFRPQLANKNVILSYFVPSSSDYNPFNTFDGSYYVDVSSTYKDKLDCLKTIYGKEMRQYPHSRSLDNIENIMKVWGSEVGHMYCEKFKFIRGVA